ncbi:MAG: deoxyribodipyrimidine photo-lyase, partial [Cyclobacteriaceae bacterium]
GKYVLYWMQQSQRAEYNHALEYAVEQAKDLDQGVVVCFGLLDDYPEANLRHYYFLVEGLIDTEGALKKRDIKLVVKHNDPVDTALDLGKDASLIVCDKGYLRHLRKWREKVADDAGVTVVQVESDVVVPVEVASDKREYAARTIRKKLQEPMNDYLTDLSHRKPPKSTINLNVKGMELTSASAVCDKLKLDTSVEPVPYHFNGGTSEAKKVFRRFLDKHLFSYDDNRNQPQTDHVSHMSKYLHFGQISPVWLVKTIQEKHSGKNVDSFVEELLVRRELAANFVYFTEDYDSFSCLPDWAQETLEKHKDDERPHSYTRQELEDAETHDDYWNAAMKEMKETGYMHNYMRMYWGKKILEWSNTPQYAYKTTLYLNNKYFLDGRDFNSFANVAWVFGNHDRGWQERDIYGKVRSMMASGLERKTEPDRYVEKVRRLSEKEK